MVDAGRGLQALVHLAGNALEMKLVGTGSLRLFDLTPLWWLFGSAAP
jgi:hypothetical protein